jgi:AraC-like DNA-binding protein
MRYTEHQPMPVLADFLECLWFVSDDEASAATRPVERVLPDGCIEWIFHLGAPFQRWTPAAGWALQSRSFVVGELTQFLLLQPTGPAAVMGVRFRPGGAYRFLALPLDALTDDIVPTADVWGSGAKYLEQAVLDARTDTERARLVEAFLLQRLVISPRPRFDAAISEIMRSRGQMRMGPLADSIGCSRRQLEREFRASAGLAPKALARIIRFQNLLRLVGEGGLREWASLALESGYADQPHMVREFREFSGQSPTERQARAAGHLARHFVSPRRLTALLGLP